MGARRRQLLGGLHLGAERDELLAGDVRAELRELVRFRHKLVNQRSGYKCQLHAVLAMSPEGKRVGAIRQRCPGENARSFARSSLI